MEMRVLPFRGITAPRLPLEKSYSALIVISFLSRVNETPCFFRFAAAFAGSCLKRMLPSCIRYMHKATRVAAKSERRVKPRGAFGRVRSSAKSEVAYGARRRHREDASTCADTECCASVPGS